MRVEIGKRVVKRELAAESPAVVMAGVGFQRSCIHECLQQYRRRGEARVATRPIPGPPGNFDDALLVEELGELVRCDPLQLDFQDALWTRGMILELLRRQFRLQVSERTVSNILKRLGITVQRPRRKAVEQDPVVVQSWLNEEWRKIRAQAKAANAVVYFCDESNLRSDGRRGTTWGVKGETPVVPKTGRRFSLNLITAVPPPGELRCMVTEDRVNADTFITFLCRLLANALQPTYLVVGGHPVHRSKKVPEFVTAQQGRLELFFLPPDSPELNPDELVWNVVKGQVSGRTVVESKDTLRRSIRAAPIDSQLPSHQIAMKIGLGQDLASTFFKRRDLWLGFKSPPASCQEILKKQTARPKTIMSKVKHCRSVYCEGCIVEIPARSDYQKLERGKRPAAILRR